MQSCLKKPCQQSDITIENEVHAERSSADSNYRTRTRAIFSEKDLMREVDDPRLGRLRFYNSVLLKPGPGKEVTVRPGDFVVVRPDLSGVPFFVAQVLSLTQEECGDENDEEEVAETRLAHVRWFARSVDTVLGIPLDYADEK